MEVRDPNTALLNKIIEEDEKISFHEFSQSSPDKEERESMESHGCNHQRKLEIQ